MRGWPAEFTFTAEEYKHIGDLREAIAAQNLRIRTEEPMNIGKFVYKITVVGPDFKEPPKNAN